MIGAGIGFPESPREKRERNKGHRSLLITVEKSRRINLDRQWDFHSFHHAVPSREPELIRSYIAIFGKRTGADYFEEFHARAKVPRGEFKNLYRDCPRS